MQLLRVGLGVLGILFTLWLFSIIAPAIMEPMHAQADDTEAVHEQGYSDDIDNILELVVKDAPTMLAGGFIVLLIVFSVWRERFDSRRRI